MSLLLIIWIYTKYGLGDLKNKNFMMRYFYTCLASAPVSIWQDDSPKFKPKILYSSSFTTWCNLIRSINVVSQLILRRFCMPYQICHAGWCNWRVWWVLEWFLHVSYAMGCTTINGEHTKVVTILKACRLWTDRLTDWPTGNYQCWPSLGQVRVG